MPKNISGTSGGGSSNSDGIFPVILANTFAARINSAANGFSVYNSVSTSPLFKIDGQTSVATFYCDLDVVGSATFTTVSNIAVSSSLMSLANDNTASDLLDIGFYGLYNNSGIKYRGLIKSASLGRWILFKDITTAPSSTVTLSGSYRDTLEVQDLYYGGSGDTLSALKTDVDGFPDALKNLTTAEVNQLENINSNTVSSTQWGYLSSADQATNAAASPTFAGITLNGSITHNSGTYSVPAGLVALPSIYFSTDTTTGFYRNSANQIGVGVSGSNVAVFRSGGLLLTAGNAVTPALNFGDSGTGLFKTTTNQLGIAINGVQLVNYVSTGANISAAGNNQLLLTDTTAVDTDVGAAVNLQGYTDSVPTATTFARIKTGKTDATIGLSNMGGYLAFYTAAQNSTLTESFRIDTSQNIIVNSKTVSGITTLGATTVNATTVNATIGTAAQTSITSLGSLTALTMAGNIVSDTTNTRNLGGSSNLWANVYATSYTGTLATVSQPNITTLAGVSTLGATATALAIPSTSITIGGTSVASSAWQYVNTLNQALTTSSNVTFGNIAGTLTTGSQPNISAVGTLTSLAVSTTTGLGISLGGFQASLTSSAISGMRISSISFYDGNVGNVDGILENFGFYTPSNTNNITAASGIRIINDLTGLDGTLGTLYGLYIQSGTAIGIGSCGMSYGAYITQQAVGTTKCALYSDNLSLGYTAVAPPASGAIISGTMSIGASSGYSTYKLYVSGTTYFNGTVTLNSTNMSGVATFGATTVNATTVSATTLTGTIGTAAQTSITSLGSLTALTMAGNILSDTTNTRNLGGSSNLWANVYATSYTGTLATVSQPNITTLAGVSTLGATATALAIPSTSITIGGTSVASTAWQYVNSMNQAVATTSTPQFDQIGIGASASSDRKLFVYGSISATSGAIYGSHLSPILGASSGTVTTAVDVNLQPNFSGNVGTITSAYGMLIEAGATAGTVTNGYSLYLTAPAYGTTKYTLYSAGYSYFASDSSNGGNITLAGTLSSTFSGYQYGIVLGTAFNPTLGATAVRGFSSQPTFNAPGGKVITDASGVYVTNTVSSNSGIITNAYGLFIDRGSSGAGTITNSYGAYITRPLHGSTAVPLHVTNNNNAGFIANFYSGGASNYGIVAIGRTTQEVVLAIAGNVGQFFAGVVAGDAVIRSEVTGSKAWIGSVTAAGCYADSNGNGGGWCPGSDNGQTLGKSGARWSQLWAGTNTINTSDINEKNSITSSMLGLEFINALNPVSFRFNNGSRTHYGLIAQEVKGVMDDFKMTGDDFAGYVDPAIGNPEDTSPKGLRYEQFIAPMIKSIQELTEKNKTLELRLRAIEAKLLGVEN